MSWINRQSSAIAHMYGYKNPHYRELAIGDEVIVFNHEGIPVCNDIIEAITNEAICVGKQWYYDFEYSVKKLED